MKRVYESDEEEDAQAKSQWASPDEVAKRKIVKVKRANQTKEAEPESKPLFSFGGGESTSSPSKPSKVDVVESKDAKEESKPEIKKKAKSEEDKEEEPKKKLVLGEGFSMSVPAVNPFAALAATQTKDKKVFGANPGEAKPSTPLFSFANPLPSTEQANDESESKKETVDKMPSPKKKVEVDVSVTGEEEENTEIQEQARLYKLDKAQEKAQWKERGRGVLHVNSKKSDSRKSRIVMRMDGAFHIILNMAIFHGMHVSRINEKNIQVAGISGDCDFASYLIRLNREEECDNVYDVLIRKVDEAEAEESVEEEVKDESKKE